MEELLIRAAETNKEQYEQRLKNLATIVSNTSFIGWFGLVLGIVMLFMALYWIVN